MHAVRSSHRPLAVALLFAAPMWAVVWGLGGAGTAGTSASEGVSPATWRALLHPALVVLVAATARWATLAPTSSRLLTLAGVTLVLLGNVLEFGLGGRPTPLAGIGAAVLGTGAVVALAGMAWTVGSAARGTSGRLSLGLGAGIGSALGVAVMTFAAPAAAAIAVIPLVDALWRAPGPAPSALMDAGPAPTAVPA